MSPAPSRWVRRARSRWAPSRRRSRPAGTCSRPAEAVCILPPNAGHGPGRAALHVNPNFMATTDTDTWMIEVDGEMIPDYDRTLTNFSEGDVVTGTVVRVDKDEILVDIGYKSEGVIPIAELSIR